MAEGTAGTPKKSWFERHPGFVPIVAAITLLQIFQGVFMALKNATLGPEAARGMAVVGVFLAPVTLLVLLPLILLLRRWHKGWKTGDPRRATWAAAVGVTGALCGWMIADQALASMSVGGWAAVLFESLAALIAGAVAAAWLQPGRRWLKAGAIAMPLLLAAAPFIAPPPPEAPGAGEESKKQRPPERRAGPQSPDVVLISIDTLRADRLGSYGRSPSITPAMDRLAEEGVVFQRALAAAPWTVPSVASMITGLPTIRHGAGQSLGSGVTFQRTPLKEESVTLAERFKAAGYRTRGVAANGFVAPEQGLAQGFDVFVNPFGNAAMSGVFGDLPLTRFVLSLIPDTKLGDYRASGVTDTALGWLSEEGDGPLFLWAHYLGPHIPLRADPEHLDHGALRAMMAEDIPRRDEDGSVLGDVFVATAPVRSGSLWLSPEDKQRLIERYDQTVTYVDEQVGRLLDALRQRQSDRGLIIALTSDHGEEFWDHGHFEHGHDYYREVTQIPLIFWGPGQVPEGLTIETLAGHVDIGPTLLDLAELDVPTPESPDEGRSLMSLFAEKSASLESASSESASLESAPSESPAPPRFSGGNLYGLPAVLVEEDRWRFILRANGQEELYDVVEDPGERSNVAAQNPDVAAHYRQLLEPRLAALLAEGDQAAEMSPAALEALKSLGYVQ